MSAEKVRILGIDPGTGIMGFGVIDVLDGHYTLVDAGVIKTPANTPHADRLDDIFNSLTEIIYSTRPTILSIEKLFFSRNITTAMSVAEARGVAMLVAKRCGMTIFEYTPQQIKQSLTGYGRADKKQVQEMVRLQLGLKEAPKPDDCADAIAAAITHSLMSRIAD